MAGLWEKLAEAKQYRWVDLTHTLTNESPYWEGIPQGSVALGEIAVPFEAMDLEIQTFKFPGQFGTHIDYPAHFVPGRARCAGFWRHGYGAAVGGDRRNAAGKGECGF